MREAGLGEELVRQALSPTHFLPSTRRTGAYRVWLEHTAVGDGLPLSGNDRADDRIDDASYLVARMALIS